jgi:pyruvate, water dikinase
MTDKWMFWFEEVGQKDNDLVGKKCANLGEMTRMGLPVPSGFSISAMGQRKFLEETGTYGEIRQFLREFPEGVHTLKAYEEAQQGLRRIVESKEISADMKKIILSYYDNLCQKRGFEVSVAVRSAGTQSHPGQYETYLNVKGKDELLDGIKKVWSSIYNDRTIASLDRQKIPIGDSPLLGVCVVEMVNSRSAGITFTGNPMTGDLSQIMIEGNWGLGESVVSGAMTPDTFIVDKTSLKILSKTVGKKGVQVVMTDKGTVEEQLPVAMRDALCITDKEIVKIAEMAKTLEKHFGLPQDMEWAVSADIDFPDSIILLQTRPAKIIKK